MKKIEVGSKVKNQYGLRGIVTTMIPNDDIPELSTILVKTPNGTEKSILKNWTIDEDRELPTRDEFQIACDDCYSAMENTNAYNPIMMGALYSFGRMLESKLYD